MKFPYDLGYFPSAPSVEIQLGVLDEAFRVGPLRALVDTGADVTIVPQRSIRLLKVQVDDRKYLRTPWGERRVVDIHFLDMGIGDMRLPCVEIVADDLGDSVILGRNVLNKLVLMLDGPKQVLEILD
jgi:predicted aspartyl protease